MTWKNNIATTGKGLYFNKRPSRLERDGYDEEVYFSNTFSPIFKSDGTVGGLFCIAQETTQKVLTTRRLKLLDHLASS
ncbi:hypothetical protein C2G38_2186253 [Gigaspora rosea]|uniref:PAC domain-containing protein n=1 Tax=Gigaspora rosea TaxID=44941 RepID=A0A397V847_9GLOM|nr:hypothetical protein C2G38_2186253 [Gigaspora rosea]